MSGKAGPGESASSRPGTQTNGGSGPAASQHCSRRTDGQQRDRQLRREAAPRARRCGRGHRWARRGNKIGRGSIGSRGLRDESRRGFIRQWNRCGGRGRDRCASIRPQNGSYEVAIVQSSGVVPGKQRHAEGQAGLQRVHSGGNRQGVDPAILPAGRRRAPGRAIAGGAARERSRPITAPYAFSIVGPAIQFRAGARYAFIHGFVNVSGRFEHLDRSERPGDRKHRRGAGKSGAMGVPAGDEGWRAGGGGDSAVHSKRGLRGRL